MLNRKIELSMDDGLITLTDQELDMVAAGATNNLSVTADAVGPAPVTTVNVVSSVAPTASSSRITVASTSGMAPTGGGGGSGGGT
jgi:hypothetical protein